LCISLVHLIDKFTAYYAVTLMSSAYTALYYTYCLYRLTHINILLCLFAVLLILAAIYHNRYTLLAYLPMYYALYNSYTLFSDLCISLVHLIDKFTAYYAVTLMSSAYLPLFRKHSYLQLSPRARGGHASPPQELLNSSKGGRLEHGPYMLIHKMCKLLLKHTDSLTDPSMLGATGTDHKGLLTCRMWQLLLKLCGLVTNISPRCCGYRGNSTNRATADGSPCAGNTNTNRNITVIITTGQLNIPLSIHVNSKVIIVKEEMQRRMHIKINEQLLSFGGKVLEDQKHLHYYCIHDSSFLRLSHFLRGGGEEHQNSGFYN